MNPVIWTRGDYQISTDPAVMLTAVEHLRDVRVIHGRQRLALARESRDDLLRVHAELDQLERDAPPDWRLLLGEVDGAHAAFTEFVEDLVGADLLRA